MTAATETRTIEHGVRYTWPGETEQVVACEDLDCVHALMDVLASKGVTRMEPVTRPAREWSLDTAGLPAAIRHLAEAHVDGQVDDGDVRARLAAWLHDRYVDEIAGAYRDLLVGVMEHREAEDGPLDGDQDREQLVRDTEARITAAVQRIVGGAQ